MKKVEGGICTWEDSQHCMPFDEVVCQKCPKFKPEPSPAKTVYCVGDGPCDKRSKDWECLAPSEPCCEQSYISPQPEPMPLRQQFERIILNATWEDDEWLNLSEMLDSLEAIVTAHDQQVRKDFAEQIIATMPYAGGQLKAGEVLIRDRQRKLDIAHLRAMAGER